MNGMFVKPDVDSISHAALGLCGEAGEVADNIKKSQYEDGIGRGLSVPRLVEELGDTLWYLTYLAGRFGYSLEELAAQNYAKLNGRYPALYPDPLD